MDTDLVAPIQKAQILIEALPYIRRLAGKTVVIKYGGNAMVSEELKTSVMEDVTLLKFIGINPILVHGGGPDVSAMLERLDISSTFHDGLRITTPEVMEVAQMVLVGRTNKEIVARLNQLGAQAVGLCGIDGRLIECVRMTRAADGKALDIGQVGEITHINTAMLETLAAGAYVPVIAPIGIGPDGESYNINADTVASEIAAAMRAEKLINLTDVEGVKRTDTNGQPEVIAAMTESEAHKLIDTGVIAGGMIPKVLGCLDTVNRGVGRAHIIDGRISHSLLLEIFTNKGIGTMIMKERRPYYQGEKI